MTTKKIYGPWIKWDGGECPVPPNTTVNVKFRGGDAMEAFADDLYWYHDDDGSDIVEYCTVIEQADLKAAEQLLLNYGYAVIPPAKPLTFEDVAPMTEAPPKGTWYWVPQPFRSRGVEAFAWGGDVYDLVVLRRRLAYLEREHALVAARHIFGLKGGEL